MIVLRHPDIGSAKVAVHLERPGDQRRRRSGRASHPGSAGPLHDQEELGTIDGIKIAMVGDLRYGRTVHSLTKLLTQYDVSLRFSRRILRLPLVIMNEVKDAGLNVRETHNVADVIENADVLYVTRVQKERFTDMAQYEEVKATTRSPPTSWSGPKPKWSSCTPYPTPSAKSTTTSIPIPAPHTSAK